MQPTSDDQSEAFTDFPRNTEPQSKENPEDYNTDYKKTSHSQQVLRFNHTEQSPASRFEMQGRSSVTHSEVGTSVPGAAFNTTPIYDAQGSLVGLQAPTDNAMLNDPNADRQEGLSYMTMPPMYPYNVASQPTSGLLPNDYLTYGTYSANPQAYNTAYAQQRAHYYPTQVQSIDPNHQKHLLMTSASVDGAGDATVIRGLPKSEPSFDQCPTVCSLLAILFCPVTLWCSVPALIYSMCAYTDYRAADIRRYQHKSDIARHLVITACVIGLLLCIAWAVLAYFYYELMLAMVGDVVRAMHNRIRVGV